MSKLLEIKDLQVAYGGIQAVRGISFDVSEGEIVTLIGANGAGKSSTLRSIVGLVKPAGGSIQFQGKELSGQSTEKIVTNGITLVPEGRRVFVNLTVYENLVMGGYTKDKQTVEKNLEYVYGLFPRLKEREKQLVGTMSGGERQMVAVARGLMSNPKIIMLDEPSMGLSPQNTLIVFDALKKLKAEGVTVLIVEQNVNTTLQFADRAYIMDQGRVVLSGDCAELRGNEAIKKMYMGLT